MTPKRIAIIGAGPIGIEAALLARSLGHEVLVFDRGEVGQHPQAWGFVRLFTPWRMNVTPLGVSTLRDAGRWTDGIMDRRPTGAELRERYLLPLAESDLLKGSIRTHARIVSIGREDFAKGDAIGQRSRADSPFRLLVEDPAGNERVEQADVVLDCSGTYGNHRWAGKGGIPAPGERAVERDVWYTIPDVLGKDLPRFAGRHALLLGAGFSAATVLGAMAHLHEAYPQTRVSWAIRRPGQAFRMIQDDPLPARRDLVHASMHLAANPPDWLQFLGNCAVEQIAGRGPFDVTLKFMNTDLVLDVDQVVAMVGYMPDSSIYEQLQVHACYATFGPMKLSAALLGESAADCLSAGASLGPDTLKNPEPDFFILGAKSYGTNSNFLLQTGHQQVRDAFRLIHADPRLDLYQ